MAETSLLVDNDGDVETAPAHPKTALEEIDSRITALHAKVGGYHAENIQRCIEALRDAQSAMYADAALRDQWRALRRQLRGEERVTAPTAR